MDIKILANLSDYVKPRLSREAGLIFKTVENLLFSLLRNQSRDSRADGRSDAG